MGKELGGCRLVRRLGSGAIGVVYEAGAALHRPARGDQDAVQQGRVGPRRWCSASSAKSKLCAQIQHPNVVSVYDCGFERGVHYLIMEYVDGQTLAGMLDEADRIPWAKAAWLRAARSRAGSITPTAWASSTGISSPANILVGTDGTAKLADLGLAKQLEDEGVGGDSFRSA